MDLDKRISTALTSASQIVAKYPNNDLNYFNNNLHRYGFTLKTFLESTTGTKLLDIGCHYLHQAISLSFLGFEVWGLDVPEFLAKDCVQKRAQDANVRLIEVANLENLDSLTGLAENAFDVIFFTEILEHIAFNPILMWREIYRVLAPEGKIIITTPNYYCLFNQSKRIKRSMKRLGGYIPIEDIFTNVTFGHHWKEYSVSELKKYFHLLSTDFQITKVIYYNPFGYPVRSFRRGIFYLFGLMFSSLQKNIYAEVILKEKMTGIQLEQPVH
jgi:2-polyprenyl-6-hydroxyphenyl methylase/3-demethylubiquinone-9 3-methyltransferase